MSSDAGQPSRDRTVVALLTVVGFVLVAAVLPVVGSDAPGRSLIPQSATGDDAGGAGSAVQRALGGESAGSSSPSGGSADSQSLVDGLLSNLSAGSPGQVVAGDRERTSSQGQGGSSGFGALNPGSQTGVGSTQNLLSDSLRNQSATPHLLVRSSEPGYWRTGAFTTYTGSGWTTRGEPAPAEWPRRPSTKPADRRTVTQEYRLLEPATALPGVYEPTDVESGFADELRVTDQGTIRAASAMPANTTYTVVSQAPPRTPERLRQAGTDYPRSIETTYTQLPAGTPDRVARRTSRIVRDAETPYAKAVAIESWLEANKRYSLNASHDGGDVADQFVFEMDSGYCEYFASSMAVMLRSQDVPARYVVGYSTGQPQGNGTYLVRAMNAHAWVEVYFPDTGWVRFDPTPGRSRLQSEFRAYQRAAETGNADAAARRFLDQAAEGSSGDGASGSPDESAGGQTGEDSETAGDQPRTSDDGSGGTNATEATDAYNHSEEGSPGESFDPSPGPSYSIALQNDPVPGQRVTVLVERDGDPAAGVTVRFNGERIGRTNESGMVRGEVPFAGRLTIDVSDNESRAAGTGSLLAPGGATVPGSFASTDGRGIGTAVQQRNGTNVTRSFDVPTDVAIAVDGPVDPGETVSVKATIDDRPIADARVSLDGSRVGTTDERGTLAVSLPGRERTTVEVSRGEAYGNRTLRLANVSVATSGFALPGLSITVSVTDGETPVEGATVAVGGRTATTGPDGTASVSLPLATGATVHVETADGITEHQPVTYRFVTAGVALVLALGLGAVLVVLRRRASAAGRSVREHLLATLRWLSGAFVAALVGLAIQVERLRSRLPVIAERVARTLRTAWRTVVAALSARRLDFGALPGPRAMLAWLLAALRGVATSAESSVSAALSTDAGSDETTAAVDEVEPSGLDPGERVRRAWREFRARLPVADYRTKTPGELAAIGIEEGFPSGAVGTLRDAIRAIEYGRRDPDSYLDDVAAAERELGDARVTDTGESDARDADAARSGAPPATDGGENE
ncbi:transglutaminaseTgpA domain-containing protein [Halorientalis brevis]|uniref:TransglutaminaseTgpA domain-containing protein n=1 Tax=Halorientalis brevis TaxID=1126241 RepID=A0ABD6CCY7_9EURY|nr:transglutaminase domain-containing protein [Halorientalis brevis]